MKYAREMLYYPLKFLKFEVVNWKALVSEELGIKIAWEWFIFYVAQVYYKRIQWNMQENCYVIPWSSLSLKWWTEKPWFRGTWYEDCVGMVYVCSTSVLQANPMKYARELLCYPLKFPKFEVVNWKALV